MNPFHEQLKRIEEKLIKAKKADPHYQVFGASVHRYQLRQPADQEDIIAFENQYQVSLPKCYASFLMHIGNGGVSTADSAAGPFYGIYPLGVGVKELVDQPEQSLSKVPVLYPDMSDEDWQHLTQNVEDDDISDEDYDQEVGKIFGGILPIGSQGCSYLHGLVLNGEYKGRVVNLDNSLLKPKFAYEKNFLDWYERWLDEIISGHLLAKRVGWFGYTKGGTEETLIQEYLAAKKEDRRPILVGILNKHSISQTTYDFIEQAYLKESDQDARKLMLETLFKANPTTAKAYLIEFGQQQLLPVFQFVFWHDKENSKQWIDFIKSNIHRIDDHRTFQFCVYLLEESQLDYADLILPFTDHSDSAIRKQTYYQLGKLPEKIKYLEFFIKGLNDPSSKVVHITLQALKDLQEPVLLKHYKRITDRYPQEENYILTNLNQRLHPFGLDEKQLRKLSYEAIENRTNKKWYEIWKK